MEPEKKPPNDLLQYRGRKELVQPVVVTPGESDAQRSNGTLKERPLPLLRKRSGSLSSPIIITKSSKAAKKEKQRHSVMVAPPPSSSTTNTNCASSTSLPTYGYAATEDDDPDLAEMSAYEEKRAAYSCSDAPRHAKALPPLPTKSGALPGPHILVPRKTSSQGNKQFSRHGPTSPGREEPRSRSRSIPRQDGRVGVSPPPWQRNRYASQEERHEAASEEEEPTPEAAPEVNTVLVVVPAHTELDAGAYQDYRHGILNNRRHTQLLYKHCFVCCRGDQGELSEITAVTGRVVSDAIGASETRPIFRRIAICYQCQLNRNLLDPLIQLPAESIALFHPLLR